MLPRPSSLVATLFVCASSLAAADGIGVGQTYTWEDLQAGKDINDRVYSDVTSGEFDEWRLMVGFAPAIDRIHVKSELNGVPMPGPLASETDKVNNNPALPLSVSLVWILGDFMAKDHGWFYALGLDFAERSYRILYAVGTQSPELKLRQIGPSLQVGYMVYVHPRLRFEIAPIVSAGYMWNQFDTTSVITGMPDVRSNGGAYITGGLRAAVTFHPTRSQGLHLGVALDYQAGYGQTIFRNDGPAGETRSEIHFQWFGFGASVFAGHRF